MTQTVVERAYAKINPCLRVLRRRDDGFHEVQTVILPLELHDVVSLEPAETTTVEVTGVRAGELGAAGGESLCERAVGAFADASGIRQPVAITVDKRVPVGAGMGGGSADAAAVIRGLARLHALDPLDLLDGAATIGSDVPALVHGGPVFAEGRGERLTALHAVTTHWVVVPQPFVVRTPDAYAWWDENLLVGPDPGALIAALETGAIDALGAALFDDLEAPVARHHPEVGAARALLREAGARGVVMTGSGPTVVGVVRLIGEADRIAATVPGAFVTSGPPATMTASSGVV